MLESWPDFGNLSPQGHRTYHSGMHDDDDYDDNLHGQVCIEYLGQLDIWAKFR